jgi:hypothetical protein
MAYARKYFELEQPAAKGSPITLRESLEQVEKTKRKRNPKFRMPELEMPPMPESLAYLWQWFSEVACGQVLTWAEIQAWSEIRQIGITARDAKIIRDLSFEQVRAYAPKKSDKKK